MRNGDAASRKDIESPIFSRMDALDVCSPNFGPVARSFASNSREHVGRRKAVESGELSYGIHSEDSLLPFVENDG